MSQEAAAYFRKFRPAWKAFGVYIVGVALFSIGPMINPDAPISPALSQLLATCFAGFIIIKRMTCLYEVDGDYVRAAISFPMRKSMEAHIPDITRIDLRRGLSNRLLGVSHVHIYVNDQPQPVVRLFGVDQPALLKKLLLDKGANDTVVTGAWRR